MAFEAQDISRLIVDKFTNPPVGHTQIIDHNDHRYFNPGWFERDFEKLPPIELTQRRVERLRHIPRSAQKIEPSISSFSYEPSHPRENKMSLWALFAPPIAFGALGWLGAPGHRMRGVGLGLVTGLTIDQFACSPVMQPTEIAPLPAATATEGLISNGITKLEAQAALGIWQTVPGSENVYGIPLAIGQLNFDLNGDVLRMYQLANGEQIAFGLGSHIGVQLDGKPVSMTHPILFEKSTDGVLNAKALQFLGSDGHQAIWQIVNMNVSANDEHHISFDPRTFIVQKNADGTFSYFIRSGNADMAIQLKQDLSAAPTISPTAIPSEYAGIFNNVAYQEVSFHVETRDQYLERIALDAKALGAYANLTSSWGDINKDGKLIAGTAEGYHYRQIIEDPNSWSEQEIIEASNFVLKLRMVEYDQMIDQGGESFDQIKRANWLAVAGFMNNISLATEFFNADQSNFKDKIHAMTKDEQMYLEISRQALSLQPIRVTPIEIKNILFDPNPPQHSDKQIYYGFNKGNTLPFIGPYNDVTIPLFDKTSLEGTNFSISFEQAEKSFLVAYPFDGDLVGLVDLSSNRGERFGILIFMRGDDGSPHLTLQEVVFKNDESMSFGPNDFYIGSFDEIDRSKIPNMVFHTNFTLDQGDYKKFDILDKQTVLNNLLTLVEIYPPEQHDRDGIMIQSSFFDPRLKIPVLGNTADENQSQTAIYFTSVPRPYPIYPQDQP